MKHSLYEIFDETTFVVSEELESLGVKSLLGLLAMLRAMVWEYYTSHWRVKGIDFYGNHLIYERLYEHTQTEVDKMAEKILGITNEEPQGFSPLPQMEMAQRWLSGIQHIDCSFERAEQLENMFLDAVRQAKESCEAAGLLTPGIENMLDQMYDDHEEHLYLIKQTLKS
jgi:DNA-binding ferritin-like protein